MTDRDQGDEPEGPDEGSLVPAESGVARARKPRGRRRSLRVPVDDVPRPSGPGVRDSDADGLPALAAEPTQVASMPTDGGHAMESADPSVEIGLDLADEELHDDDLALDDEDADAAGADAAGADAADADAAGADAADADAADADAAGADAADADAVDADAADAGFPDDLGGSDLESEPTRVAASDLESEPTRVAASSASVVPPPPAWVASSAAAPFAPGAGVSARPVSVPPPSGVGTGVSARPLTVPPPARPATIPPSRPASVPPPARPASVPPPTRPASVPPPARPASAAPPDRAASVPPPAREPSISAAIETDSQNGVTSPGTTDTPLAEPRRSQPPTAAQRAAQPAVVVARMVRVSSPPPATTPEPAPSVHDDEPELSVGEIDAFEEFEVDDDRESMETLSRDSAPRDPASLDSASRDFGSRDSAPDLTDEALEDSDGTSSAEIELPEHDAEDADEPVIRALRPPPPPREAARVEAPSAQAQHAEPSAQAEHEEELSDLEVDDPSGELEDDATREERQAHAEAQLRSAPPPPPDKAPKVAPPSAPGAASAEPAAEPARRTKKKPNWWEDFFNDDYLRTVPPPHPRQIARQCDFIETRFGLKAGGTILDVGCGLGLHAIELTRRGYLVVGLDLSLPMLSRAADEAQDHGFRINFLHADMREMNFEGAFDAVMCIGTTYGYFDDDANRALVERLYRALKPKGKLLLEVVNRDFVVRSQPNLVWFEGDGCVVMEETKANYITSRLEVKRTVILDDGRQRDNAYSVRLYALHELGLVLHQRGFRVLEVSGREATPGVFFGADSPKLIMLAERRVQQAPPPPKKSGGTPGEGPSTGELMQVDVDDASSPAEPSGNGSET